MSRSIKKHFGGKINVDASDVWWKQDWHQKLRRKTKQILHHQIRRPDEDFMYPIAREVANLWAAPSDGGAHWQYHDFEHYYREDIDRWYRCRQWQYYSGQPFPTREEAWKEFIKMYGK